MCSGLVKEAEPEGNCPHQALKGRRQQRLKLGVEREFNHASAQKGDLRRHEAREKDRGVKWNQDGGISNSRTGLAGGKKKR